MTEIRMDQMYTHLYQTEGVGPWKGSVLRMITRLSGSGVLESALISSWDLIIGISFQPHVK